MWNRDIQYTRVKLCWFEFLEAAYEASTTGADALGFHILKGGATDWRKKATGFGTFFAALPANIEKVLLIDYPIEVVLEVLRLATFDSVQLYPDWPASAVMQLKANAPRPIRIIKVMSAQLEENQPRDFRAFIDIYRDTTDAILLDSCREGGSGRTSDWSLCREIVAASTMPVFLAGGLHADNVGSAIQAVRPFGVDVETGVSDRVEGVGLLKNMAKCREFVAAVSAADRDHLRSCASRSISETGGV